MQLMYPLFAAPMQLQENRAHVLVIENASAFYTFSQDLLSAMQNNESKVILSKNFETLSFSKYVDVIFATELVELNSKKILQRLHKTLKQSAYNETFYLQTMELQGALKQYAQALCDAEAFPLIFEELDVDLLLKGMNVKLEIETSSLTEKICTYIDIMSTYFGIHIFFFFHLKSYLDENELQSIYTHCNYQKEQLILCESMERPLSHGEKMLLIDNDLCQIT